MSSLWQSIQQEQAKVKPARLLIVEDDLTISRLLQEYLSTTYNTRVVDNGREAIQICQNRPPDLVLIDTELSDMNVHTLFRTLYPIKLFNRFPIIFLGQRDASRNEKMKALEMGIDDYIPKPFDIEELRLRIKNALPSLQDATDLVTGLPGWLATENEINHRLQESPWSLMLMRLDHLRPFQDTHGLVASHQVRRSMAGWLNDILDDMGNFDDFVGMIGEQTFIVITTNPNHERMMAALRKRFQAALSNWYTPEQLALGYIRQPEGKVVPLLSLSHGTVSSHSKSFADSLDVIKTADALRQRTTRQSGSGLPPAANVSFQATSLQNLTNSPLSS